MEVLGAVASAATLAQLAVKGVEFLQKIPEIQSDYSELCSELAFIETIVRDAQQNSRQDEKASSRAGIQDQVSKTVSVLDEISKGLYDIKSKCERQRARGDPQVSKKKWVMFGGKVGGMLQKAHRAKTNLHMAITMDANMMHRQTNVDMREVKGQLYSSLPVIERQLSHVSQYQMFIMSTQEQILNSQPVKDSLRIHELDGEDNTLGTNEIAVAANDMDPSTAVGSVPPLLRPAAQGNILTALRKTKCAVECACRCHTRPWKISSPWWIEKLTGPWELKYKRQVARTSWELRCPCSKSENLTIEWALPDWSLIQYLFPGRHKYSLRCALRPVRVLEWRSTEFQSFHHRLEYVQKRMAEGVVLFPDDQNENGNEFVTILIGAGNFEVLEFLLVQWVNILPEQGFPRNVGFSAAYCLEFRPPDECHVRLLEQILSYFDDEVDEGATTIHEAALRGFGVQESLGKLHEGSHVLNALDKTGNAPLHHAARMGHAQAVQELIDAGANVNCKTFNKFTPLTFAAVNGHTECMQKLLLSGRIGHIDEQGSVGESALHLAAETSFPTAVQLLLLHEASPCLRNFRGSSPLHTAAESHHGSTASVEAILQMLLDAPKTDIDGVDDDGYTAVMRAIKKEKPVAVRFLARAGASLATVTKRSRNILHIAAKHTNLDLLLFLHGQNLACINWRLVNAYRKTPWDRFMGHLKYGSLKPSPDEMIAFVQLYQGIRDRDLAHDISLLEQALAALYRKDEAGACLHLSTLVQHKQTCQNADSAEFYRGIRAQISSGDMEAPRRCIEADLQDLKLELDSSPWDQESTFNESLSDSDPDASDDQGSVESDESPESDSHTESDLDELAEDDAVLSDSNEDPNQNILP